jgi:hypothetical protein
MKNDANHESGTSRRVRRAAGMVSLLGLGVAVVGGLAGYEELAMFGFLVFLFLPWATMITHLTFTRSMTKEEKAMWRRELAWSQSVFAVWAYMFSTDLKERARGFRPYRPQDPGNAG